MKKILNASISVLLLISSSRAAVSVSYTDRENAGFEVSNSDLLQTNLSAINPFPNAEAFQQESVLGVPELNNGIFGALGGGNWNNARQSATAGDGGGYSAAGQSILYTLDGGNLGMGYNLTGISTYAGWDAYRGGQSYTVAYSTVFNIGTFIDIATVFDNFQASRPNLCNTEAKITSTESALATNVATIRFTFNGGLSAGYAGYRELDVFGFSSTVTNPPPPLPPPPPSPPPSPPAGTAATLEISALIDGRDQLIIHRNTLQWHHLDFAAVGRWQGANQPTILTTTIGGEISTSGLQWIPDWSQPPPNEIRFQDYSSIFTGLDAALPDFEQSLVLDPIQVRSGVSIVQQPSALNDFTAIVEFNDNPAGGATTYDLKIGYQIIPEPSCALLLLSGAALLIRRRRIQG